MVENTTEGNPVSALIITSAFSFVRFLLTTAVQAAEVNEIPLDQVDEAYEEIKVERKKKKASALIDV